jgi:PAS domain S-box-containing protein
VAITNPDLILLDVMLPGLDGFEVCRRLQAQPQTADIPVIFLTSLGGIQDKVKGFEAGAVDYITKPLQIDEVRIRISTHLKLRVLQKTLEDNNRKLQAEIAERKRMEDVLSVREREFRSLAENLPDNVARWDAEGRILYSNPTHQRTLGKPASELIGKKQSEIFPDGRFSRGDEAVARIVASGKPALLRETVADESGALSTHEINFVPEFDEAGQVVSVLGLGRDMTDIFRMQEAIAASERKLRSLADSSPGMMGMFHSRPDGSICMPYVSPNIREFFGLHPHEVKDSASPLMARIHPDDAQRVGEAIAESARNMTPLHEQYRILHPARGELWMESHANPESHPDGGVVWYGYVHDITERKRIEDEIKLKEFALDQSHEAVYLIEEDGLHFAYVNEAACRSLGYSRDELLSLTLPDIDPYLSAEEAQAIEAALYAEGVATLESRHRRRDGSSFPVEIQNSAFEYQGRMLSMALARDITERKQTLMRLERLERAVNQAADAVFMMDEEFRFIYVNVEACRSLGYSREELLTMTPLDIDPNFTFEELFKMQQNVTPNQIVIIESQHRARDGRVFTVEIGTSKFVEENGAMFGLSVVRDITERKRIEHDLEEYRTQLRGLISQREEAREEERKIIAREVHDNLGQILGGLHLSIFRLESRYAANSEEMRKFIQDAMALTDQAIGEVRNISSALRPVELDMGIHAALAWKAARFAAYTGIACEVYDEAADIKLDEHYSITLFRIAQESLTNVARHSGADRVDISLKKEAGDYVLTVRDNGNGFDAGVKKERSFGLVGMRERAAMLGGSIAINSGVGKGTEVVVRLPARE